MEKLINHLHVLSPRVRTALVTVLMFFAVLGPRFGIVDCSVLFLLAYAVVPLTYLLKKRKLPRLELHEKYLAYLFVYALVIFSLEFSLNVDEHGQYLFRVLRSGLFYVFLASLHYQFRLPTRTIVLALVNVLVINLFITYAQSFDLFGLREFFAGLNTLSPREANVVEWKNLIMEGARVKGLLKGFDSNSLAIASLLFIAMFFSQSLLIQWCAVLITLLGTILAARVGFIAAVSTLLLYLIKSAAAPKRFFVLLGIVVSACTLLFFVIPKLPEHTVARFSELAYITKGRSSSFEDTRRNHLTLRYIKSPRIYLIGKPMKQHVEFKENVLSSDVGYIQFLFNFGALNLLLLIFIHLWVPYEAWRSRNPDAVVYAFAVAILFLVNLKGPYFFSRTIYDGILLMFFQHAAFLRKKACEGAQQCLPA